MLGRGAASGTGCVLKAVITLLSLRLSSVNMDAFVVVGAGDVLFVGGKVDCEGHEYDDLAT